MDVIVPHPDPPVGIFKDLNPDPACLDLDTKIVSIRLYSELETSGTPDPPIEINKDPNPDP